MRVGALASPAKSRASSGSAIGRVWHRGEPYISTSNKNSVAMLANAA